MMMTKQATQAAQTTRMSRGHFEPCVSSPLRPRVLDPESQIDKDAPASLEGTSHCEGKSGRSKGKNKMSSSASITDKAEIGIVIRISRDVGDDEVGEKKLDDDDDDEDQTRAALGDITHLLIIPANSKTFCLPQIIRPSSHKCSPRSIHKVAEQDPEPGPSEKTQTATTTPRGNNAALSVDLEVELPEQDENIPPPFTPIRRHRSGTAPSRPRVPFSANSSDSPDHAEMARRIVLKYRKEMEDCDKWNAESRKLVSMRGTCRGRRLIKKSDRISNSPLLKSEAKNFCFGLGELPEDKGLGFEIYVDEDYKSTASSDAAEEGKKVPAAIEDSSSISDFELPSPVFEKSSLHDTLAPEK
ncbi:hypothetical protein QBC36DRAFT_177463 [Triangularia setosa]|uniref:Uncharacterized protein n=1 Tax=Triangularia setosa TaxID=2587417 RepID=A0AAN7A9Q3_9PEZI|nr:hypothetical protein QBC36DRAFT_177463 [Podospora setosa]